jgi:hypothetical protein
LLCRPARRRVGEAESGDEVPRAGARFGFGNDPAPHSDAVPFDMYHPPGFGHGVTEMKVRVIGQAIHDADLDDEKFGRVEGIAINQILKGGAKQGISDEELLRRGMDIIEGTYHSIGQRAAIIDILEGFAL